MPKVKGSKTYLLKIDGCDELLEPVLKRALRSEMIIKFCVSIYLVTNIIHLEQIRTNFIRSFVNAHIKANVWLDFVSRFKF